MNKHDGTIAPDALVHLPEFERRPQPEYVSAWLAYIDGTGYPERFDKVSTSHPPKDADVVLLSGEIRVPVLRRGGGEWVPCPICHPEKPWFKVGRMAWFPQEKVVRFIGADCAAKHFGEKFATAEAHFKRVARLQQLVIHWNTVTPHIEAIRANMEATLPVAQAIGLVRELMDGEAKGFAPWLYRELTRGRPGEISMINDTGLRDKRGQPVFEPFVLGVVQGVKFLDDGFQPEAYIAAAAAILADMKTPLPAWAPGQEDEQAESEIEKRAGEAFYLSDYVSDGLQQIAAGQDFLGAESLALLERWAKNEQSPFRSLICRIENKCLRIRSVSFAGIHYINALVGEKAKASVPPLHPLLAELKSLGGLSRKKSKKPKMQPKR